MDKDTKFIFVLLAIIAILAGVFIWKIATPAKERNYTEDSVNNNIKHEVYSRENELEKEREETEKIYEQKEKGTKTVLRVTAIAMFIIGYLLRGIAIYKIVQQDGSEPAWLAFIPFAQWYLIAKVAFNGATLLGIIYILGNLIGFVWENKILDSAIGIIGLYILYRLFKKFADRPNHKLGNLMAFEILSVIVLGVLCVMKLSDYGTITVMIAAAKLVMMGPVLVEGIYMYRFSKKITG